MTLQEQRLTSPSTNAPSARVANSESILPQTYTELIKPNSFGRDAPCSPKVKAPPRWDEGFFPLFPCPLSPPSVLAQELHLRPEGTWTPAARSRWARGNTGLFARSSQSSSVRAPLAQPARGWKVVRCSSHSSQVKVPGSRLSQATSLLGTAAAELLSGRWGGGARAARPSGLGRAAVSG